MAETDLMEKLTSLCKRRGFIAQSSEIYGGLNGCWDFLNLGVELKRNIKEAWWKAMVKHRNDIVGIDAAILMHPNVWKASGHVDNFTDPLVDCKDCRSRFRADHLTDATKCPKCGGTLTPPRQFNLMFKTYLGSMTETADEVNLRPETAQGIFVNFKTVQVAARLKPPFGIAQIGKSFRNEINPRNFIYRSREFEQMEMEFFVPPGEDEKWYRYWVDARYQWYLDIGIRAAKLHKREHDKKELAHYAKATTDIEYEFPFGVSELEGIANRTDFDLKRHSEVSGKDLSYFDEQTKEKYIPYVIEPAAGVDRIALVILADAYDEETDDKGETRVVLRFHPRIAPVKVAVFPLVKKEGMPEMARKIEESLRDHCNVFYDESGAVGRRYRRQDEVGTPYCVTVDGQSIADGTVTLRERDSMAQERVSAAGLLEAVAAKDRAYRGRR